LLGCNFSKERLDQVEPLMAATYVFFMGIAVVAAVVAIANACIKDYQTIRSLNGRG
jgi:hypothetical protein